MPSIINSTGTSSGVATTADASGVLELQGGGNTGITIDATGAVTFSGSSSFPLAVEDLAALKAVADRPEAVLVQGRTTVGDGGQGTFTFVTGNQSASITADPEEGIWAAPNSDPTGASGAWKRLFAGAAYAEWFGADYTGVGDSTTALIAAGASGLNFKFHEDGIYRLTAEIPLLAGTRFQGDGSQIFRQYTTNLGCFIVEGDDCEVSGVSAEYMPARAYTIANITNAATAVMTFAADVPFISGDRVRVTYEPAGMTQVNRTSPYLTRIDSHTFEMYSDSARTTPVDSSAYGAYVAGAKAALQPAGRLGLSGFQSVCGVWLQGNRAVVRDFKATNFFNAATLRGPLTTVVKNISGVALSNPATITCIGHGLITGMSTLIAGVVGPTTVNGNRSVTRLTDDTFTVAIDTSAQPAYVSGGTCTNYDNRALSSGLEISRIRAVSCDFVITAGQYEDFLFDGVRMDSPTEHTVPPHAIYLQNPSLTGQTYEGFVERGIIRDVLIEDYPFGRALRLSNVKDVTIETLTLDGCLSGLNLSRCFRVKVIAPNIINLQDIAIGIELSDTGEDNQIIGGQISGASGATFTGILASDTNPRTEVLGTKFITDNATWSSSSRRMVQAELQSSVKATDITVHHLQSNTCFAFASTGTSTLDVILPKCNGTRLIVGDDTAVVTGLIDPNLLPAGYDPASTSWIDPNTATVTLRNIAGETFYTVATAPTLAGETVAGSNTYGAATPFTHTYRVGNQVWLGSYLRLTSLDGKVITAITQANPGVVTCVGHGFTTGASAYIQNVGGMATINGQTVVVTSLTADTFSIGVDTTAYGAYTSGGQAIHALTGITQANPGVVTMNAHGFSNGKVTALRGVAGMTQINGQLLTVTVLTANTFSVGVNTTAYGAYTSGGKATQMEGAITAGDSVYTANGGTVGSTTVNTVIDCDIAVNLQGLPATHSGIKAELIEATKRYRYFYNAPSATGQTRTYLTAANFTDTTTLGFICGGYYTDDAP